MATITGTVRIIDPFADIVHLSSSTVRVSRGSGQLDSVKTGTVRILDPFDYIVKLTSATRRRSPGDLGYAGVPVVGTVLASTITLKPGVTRVAYYPGASYYCTLTSQRIDTGIQNNADSLPTVVAFKNGVVDSGFVLTAAAAPGRTGVYVVTGTVPSGYARGDKVDIVAQAIVNSITENETLDSFEVGGLAVRGQSWP